MKKNAHMNLLDEQEKIELEGTVERIVFHNAENGFTVLKLADAETKSSCNVYASEQTAVGHMLNPKAGVRVRLAGRFVNNQRFGKQLAFDHCEEILPVSSNDLQSYLGCGQICGIGPELARRIVETFGEETIRIFDEEPERLLEVRGVGLKNLEKIIDSWHERHGMRDLMLFLQPHGISAAYGTRIFKAYGGDAKQIVSQNPYRLAMDIRGIGFITADSIASKLGFASDHPLRIQAGALYLLQKASEDGHVYLPYDILAAQLEKQTGANQKQYDEAIRSLVLDGRIKTETLPERVIAVYLSRFHHCESKTAFYLQRIMASPKSVQFGDARKIVSNVVNSLKIQLANAQLEAVYQSTKNKILVITGGPGTGKTTIINAIIKTYESVNAKILLAAPTGRAAKRMAEASGHDAKTIHRLLEYSPREDAFLRNEDNPLQCHLIIIDEASMMDTLLFYYLLKAIPLGATVVLVGDVCQLPSVGPGNVLGDIIESGAISVIKLTEIFRQTQDSEIVSNAHLINNGKMPLAESNPANMSDFYFFAMDEPEAASEFIVDLIKKQIPRKFNLDPLNNIQFLTPMHKGAVGAERMNYLLQNALNPNGYEVRKGERIFRLHDKVMQLRNNYDKDIFNGDIGRITLVDVKNRSLIVNFDGTKVPYKFEELDEITPAYAISIHKAQGSEYPAVIIPVMMQHYVLLQRNLIYTGVTRGKRLVILVGERRALEFAIHNNKTSKRYTWLAQRLISARSGLL